MNTKTFNPESLEITMQTLARYFQRPHWRTYVFVAVLLALGFFAGTSPAHAADANCALVGTTRTCELWAKTGAIQLPDLGNLDNPSGFITVPIWGYADSAAGAAGLPGPTLVVNEGETLQVILHNDLAETTSLTFRGASLPPDTLGVSAGGDNSAAPYILTALQPGTYMYEAGLTTNGPRQVAMGLFGALIVRPAGHPDWAYDANSAFDAEAVLVLSEIDPAFNANPAGFDMTNYAPQYWLINGKAYPDTASISVATGRKLLIRYLNAGLQSQTMNLLGLDQTILADSGSPLAYPYGTVSETVSPGQTLDAMVTVTGATGAKYALFNTTHLSNNGRAFGGMMTFLTIASPPADTTGPATTGSALPNPTSGVTTITLSATGDDTLTGNSNVVAAEYFNIANPDPGAGLATAMSPVDALDTATESFTASIDITGWADGDYTFAVRSQDAAGNWGATTNVVVTVSIPPPTDVTGPSSTITTAPSPNPADGTVDVTFGATVNDSTTGNSIVAAAEYFIDATGANSAGVAMSGAFTTPNEAVTGAIPIATLTTLANGTHTIYVHGKDAANNWGAFVTTTFDLNVPPPPDTTGPTSTITTLPSPNPADGTVDMAFGATVDDSATGNSVVTAAEYFIDMTGADGAGVAMSGAFTTPNEVVTGAIPTATLATLANGTHTIYVHGTDAANNWGAFVTTTFDLNVLPPPATMHISALSGASATVPGGGPARWRATVTITVVDNNGNLVSGATVNVSWSAGDGNGRQLSCTTNASGQCTVQSGRLQLATAASVVMTVNNATHATLTYNAADNVVSSISVNRP